MVWWPGLSLYIDDIVKQCRKCTELRASPKEPVIPIALTGRGWQVVSTNICCVKKRPYLIVMGYFSKFIEVNYLASLTAVETIRSCKSVFASHGIQEIVQ